MASLRSTNRDFDDRLNQLFGDLVAKMQRPGFSEAVEHALFGGTEALNKSYRLGATETID